MIKKLIALTIALSVNTQPSFAIENGESALNDPRVVQTYFTASNNKNIHIPNCSGWLYSSRIVFTAGHCVYDWSQKPQKILRSLEDTYVGKPGAIKIYGESDLQVKASKIFAYDSFDWYNSNPGGTLSYKDDFAIIILEKPLSSVNVANLATKEFLNELGLKNSFIETAGYGYQNNSRQFNTGDEPKKAKFKLVSFETGMKTVNEFKQNWNRSYFQEDAMFVAMPKNGAAPCDGDSGAGYFYNENGKYTYLGAMMGLLGSPNCGLGNWTDTAVAPFRPVYLDTNMIKLAENYVLNNPYIEQKQTVQLSNKNIVKKKCVKLKNGKCKK
jgi:secreted trypsin-like serine protease